MTTNTLPRRATSLAITALALVFTAATTPAEPRPAVGPQDTTKPKATLTGGSKPLIADNEEFEVTVQGKDLPDTIKDSDVTLKLAKFNENFDLNKNIKVKVVKKTKRPVEVIVIRSKALKIKDLVAKIRDDDTMTVSIVGFTETVDIPVLVGD